MDRRRGLIVLLAGVLVVLYPDPMMLVLGVSRLASLPPVGDLQIGGETLPDNPTDIEAAVHRMVPYASDFQVYGVPWYIPTPEEVVEAGRGDCKSRAVLLAAIFEEKGIPYTFHISPVHFWVDYPGKMESAFSREYENASAAICSDGEWRLPSTMDLRICIRSWKAVLWDSMPLFRRVVLVTGILAIFLYDRKRDPVI